MLALIKYIFSLLFIENEEEKCTIVFVISISPNDILLKLLYDRHSNFMAVLI